MDALDSKAPINRNRKSDNLGRIFQSALRNIIPASGGDKKSPVSPVDDEKQFVKYPVLGNNCAHLHKKEELPFANKMLHKVGMGSKVPNSDTEIRRNNKLLASSGYSSFSPYSTFSVSSGDTESNRSHGQEVDVHASSKQSSSIVSNGDHISLNSAHIPVSTEASMCRNISTTSYEYTKNYSNPSVFTQMSYFGATDKYSSESPCSVKPPKPRALSEVAPDDYDSSFLSRIADEDDVELPWDSSGISSPMVANSCSQMEHGYRKSSHRISSVASSSFENNPFLVYPKAISPKRKNSQDGDETKKVKTLSGCFRVGQETKISESILNYESPRGEKYKSRSLKKNGEYFSHSGQRSGRSTPRQRLRLLSEEAAHNVSTLDLPTSKYYNSGHSPIMRDYVPQYSISRNLPEECTFIDTHCHLDFLFKRAQHRGSFASYRENLKEYFPQSYESCVTVFCDPTTFKQNWFWKPLIDESGVWAAFGCHPHHAKRYSEEIDEALLNALEHTRVKALGEIGLDYSYKNTCDKKVQMTVFKRQIQIALSKKLPLVIHCRDAHSDGIEIMKKMVPQNHLIHLHCFTDTWEYAKEWLDAFPNLFIGITNVVTYPSATSVHEVVRKLPLDRLLLETDAPYFLPRTLPKSLKWSHPGMAIHVAAQIAAIRRTVTLKEVLRASRENTKIMYSI